MCTKLAKICKSWAPPPAPKKNLGALFCTPILFFRLSCRWGHLISLHFHVNKNWRCWVGEWNRHEMQCINLSIYQQRTHHLGEFILIFDSAGPLQELFAQLKRTRSNWHTRHHYIDILYKKLLLFPVLLSTVMFRWWHFAAYDTDGFYFTHSVLHTFPEHRWFVVGGKPFQVCEFVDPWPKSWEPISINWRLILKPPKEGQKDLYKLANKNVWWFSLKLF